MIYCYTGTPIICSLTLTLPSCWKLSNNYLSVSSASGSTSTVPSCESVRFAKQFAPFEMFFYSSDPRASTTRRRFRTFSAENHSGYNYFFFVETAKIGFIFPRSPLLITSHLLIPSIYRFSPEVHQPMFTLPTSLVHVYRRKWGEKGLIRVFFYHVK